MAGAVASSAVAACGGQSSSEPRGASEPAQVAEIAPTKSAIVPTRAASQDATAEPTERTTADPAEQSAPVKFVPLSDEEETLARGWKLVGWKTDFSRKTIDLGEVRSGGPPRDGIPPIRRPRFVSIEVGNNVFDDLEPVVAFELNGEARAYPLQILTWHEIVDDELGGEPVLITFCPLCNTALSFSREVDGRIFDFGTSGKLRASNLIMWDSETESW